MDSVIFWGKDDWLWPWFSLFRGRHFSLRKWAYKVLKIIKRDDSGTSRLSFAAQFFPIGSHRYCGSGGGAQSCPALQPHGLQQARFPCLSLSPGVCSNSCPLSWWWYLIISSSAALFSFPLQYFPASGSFPVELALCIRWRKYWNFSLVPILPLNIQDWFPLELTDLILLSKGLSRIFSSTIQKHQFFSAQLSLWFNFHIHIRLLEKP